MTHRTPTANDTQPVNVPVPDGDGTPTQPATNSEGVHADPTPAATPIAAAEEHPQDGDRAGAGRPTSLVRDPRGRFTPKPMIPPMGADLAAALLDAQAEVWRVDNATRTAQVTAFAVGFEDRARHGEVQT